MRPNAYSMNKPIVASIEEGSCVLKVEELLADHGRDIATYISQLQNNQMHLNSCHTLA